MTTAKPTVAEDDLSKACAKVGRFLHEFALVEQEIAKWGPLIKAAGISAD